MRRTLISANSLPLELQQHIFDFLDSRTFAAARNVCRYWRFAASGSVTLERQLCKLPILPPADVGRESPRELARLYDVATQVLMLGMRVSRKSDDPQAAVSDLRERIQMYGTSRGSRAVVVEGGVISLFDLSSNEPVLVKERKLSEFEGLVNGGPWLNMPPLASRCLALSQSGRLLAIAKERTIQVIDLLADGNRSVVRTYGTWVTGQSICGLAFEGDDYLLRVSWNDRGRVVYYGAPPASPGTAAGFANMLHWQGRTGLGHALLDTAKLIHPSADYKISQESPRLTGLQLLRPAYSGFLFGAQQHGGGHSSHYIYGHIRLAPSGNALPLSSNNASITILSRLDSFLSSMPYTLGCGGSFADDRGLWEHMPSAHEHHPSFALSSDSNLFLLAERSKKELRHRPRTQLFLYRLPSLTQVEGQLGGSQSAAPNETCIAAFEARQDGMKRRRISMKYEDFEVDRTALRPVVSATHRIGRIPICLGMVLGSTTELDFRQQNPGVEQEGLAYHVAVSTSQSTTQWSLLDL